MTHNLILITDREGKKKGKEGNTKGIRRGE